MVQKFFIMNGMMILARQETNREAARDVTLFCALPKGDRQKRLIEQSVELGVRRVENTVAVADELTRLERSRRDDAVAMNLREHNTETIEQRHRLLYLSPHLRDSHSSWQTS